MKILMTPTCVSVLALLVEDITLLYAVGTLKEISTILLLILRHGPVVRQKTIWKFSPRKSFEKFQFFVLRRFFLEGTRIVVAVVHFLFLSSIKHRTNNMDDHTFLCPLCKKTNPSFLFLAHIPACYHQLCVQQKIVPYCTCLHCKGASSHPNDSLERLNGETSLKRSPSLSTEKINVDDDKQMLDNNNPSTEVILSGDQMIGKKCVLCGEAPKAKLPAIQIGRYKVFKICKVLYSTDSLTDNPKKAHLKEPSDRTQLIMILNQELNKVRTTRDAKSAAMSFEHGSQEDEVEGTKSASSNPAALDKNCRGYLDVANRLKCGKKTDSFLKIEDEYFCNGNHSIRYVLSHHCRKGKTRKKHQPEKETAKKSSKKSSNKQEKESESEGDEEEGLDQSTI